jgi:DNA polymerase-3 subunit beta
MKFRCSHADLSQALDIVNHVIDTNVTLPVLNNILIKCQGKKVHFSATNLEMAVNFSMEAEVVNEGAVTVPAKLFSSYVNLVKDEKLECSVIEGLTLAMNSAGSKTKMKCIAAEEYPTISSIEETVSFELEKEGLADSIHQVCFAASTMNTRPVLAGVFLEVEGQNLTLVATDSFRLSEKKIKLSQAVPQPATCIIPSRTTLEFARLCSKDTSSSTVQILMGKNQILFRIGAIELYSRLIEGNFPNYRQILPRSIRTSTTMMTSDQANAVKRVNLFAKENNNKVLFDFQKDKLSISTPATQIGEEHGELPIALDGEPGTIALNSEFVLDMLSHLGSDQVEVGINDAKSPAVFKAVGNDDFVHIIMPLKLQ